jgi:hypothetical protein
VNQLRQDYPYNVVVVAGLINFPPSIVAEKLLPMLARNEGDQQMAISLAGKLDDPRMVDALADIARQPVPEDISHDMDAISRTRQALAIGELVKHPNGKGIPIVVELLSASDERTRQASMIGLDQAVLGKVDQRFVDGLFSALDDRSPEIRDLALKLLKRCDPSATQPHLREKLQRDE